MYEDPLTVTVPAYRRNFQMARVMSVDYEEVSPFRYENPDTHQEVNDYNKDPRKPKSCRIPCVLCTECPADDCTRKAKYKYLKEHDLLPKRKAHATR